MDKYCCTAEFAANENAWLFACVTPLRTGCTNQECADAFGAELSSTLQLFVTLAATSVVTPPVTR